MANNCSAAETGLPTSKSTPANVFPQFGDRPVRSIARGRAEELLAQHVSMNAVISELAMAIGAFTEGDARG